MHAVAARIAFVLLVLTLDAPALSTHAQPAPTTPNSSAAGPSASLSFHIPAQPLEKALVAYGLAARVQVLYDARLVASQQSTAVDGRFSPGQALEILLRGTGLHVRYVTAGAITLAADATPSREVLVMRAAQIQAPDVQVDARRFQQFGQSLQQRLVAALRTDTRTQRRPFDVTLRVWLDADGGVARTEFVGGGVDEGDQAIIADVLRGAGRGEPPPTDLPQPMFFHFQSKPAY